MPSVSPYATALDLGRPKPNWVPRPEDAERVQSYHTYEDVFHNVKDAFSVVLRDADGEELGRRYVPAAPTIIEATNRYLARDLGKQNVRSNLISAGPIGSMAAKSIPGFSELADVWNHRSPLEWNMADPGGDSGRLCNPA